MQYNWSNDHFFIKKSLDLKENNGYLANKSSHVQLSARELVEQ